MLCDVDVHGPPVRGVDEAVTGELPFVLSRVHELLELLARRLCTESTAVAGPERLPLITGGEVEANTADEAPPSPFDESLGDTGGKYRRPFLFV